MGIRLARTAAAATALITAAVMLTGCGGQTRSVEAFCSTMDKHKERYLEQMTAAQGGDLLGGMVTAVAAVGDLKLMWRELADVAPADIQMDAEVVRDAWERQEENAAGMDWAAALATGLLNSGSMSRVDEYVRVNCDGDYTVDTTGTDGDGEEPVEPAEPEPAPAILEDAWTDDDGYTYAFELSTFTPTTEVDIANARPGEANVTWAYALTGTLTNTTPERNAPRAKVLVEAIWPAGSVICSLDSSNVVDAWSSNTPGQGEQFCSLSNFPFSLESPSDLSMGTSLPVQTQWGGMFPLVVPEASADALVAELQSPAGWVIARDNGDGRLTDCLLETGSWYLTKSTVDTGCTP